LYNVEIDPSEAFDVAEQHPEILAQAAQRVAAHRQQLVQAPTLLDH
jgi:hypothetical protein